MKATYFRLFHSAGGERTVMVPAGEDANKLIETLPGRFCYIVFRPERQAPYSPEATKY